MKVKRGAMMEEKIPKKWTYLVIALFLIAGGVVLWRERWEPRPSAPLPGERFAERHPGLRRAQDAELRELRGEVATLKRAVEGSAARIRELRSQLAATQRELDTARERLEQARRERDRIAQAMTNPAAKAAPEAVQATAGAEAPRAGGVSPPEKASLGPSWRGPAETGTYETIRMTSVYAQPSGTSRRVATIVRGTHVQVVGSRGEWLEVRSEHGNPPGFIRREDAMFLSARD